MAKSTSNAARRKSTRQRAAILDALERAPGFRSAQELHDDLRRSGAAVGLTTVYRNLQALADAGDVDVLTSAEGESIYRRCEADDHHHHLVCRSCRRTVEVEADEIESWIEQLGRRHGFTSVTHTVEAFGLCGECAAG